MTQNAFFEVIIFLHFDQLQVQVTSWVHDQRLAMNASHLANSKVYSAGWHMAVEITGRKSRKMQNHCNSIGWSINHFWFFKSFLPNTIKIIRGTILGKTNLVSPIRLQCLEFLGKFRALFELNFAEKCPKSSRKESKGLMKKPGSWFLVFCAILKA